MPAFTPSAHSELLDSILWKQWGAQRTQDMDKEGNVKAGHRNSRLIDISGKIGKLAKEKLKIYSIFPS